MKASTGHYINSLLLSGTFLFTLWSIVFSPLAFSVPVEGNISVDTTWDITSEPYTIATGTNFTIERGFTLTINPGVSVKFDTDEKLSVFGTIEAIGTSASQINFGPSGSLWGGIEFNDSADDVQYDGNGNYLSGSALEYVVVSGVSSNILINGIMSNVNAAISLKNTFPRLNSVTIQNNKTSAIYAVVTDANTTPGTLTISNSNILNNEISDRPHSPGISIFGDSQTVINILSNTFSNNADSKFTYDATSTAKAGGGGLFISEGNQTDINGNTFTSNLAANGGAIYLKQQIAPLTTAIDTLIRSNLISDNKAMNGAGIYLVNSVVKIENNQLIANTSSGNGAGIFTKTSTLGVIRNLFLKQRATNTGGGIYVHSSAIDVKINNNVFYKNHSDIHGGGLDVHDGIMFINGNTFSDNTATGKGDVLNINGGNGSFTGNSVQGLGANSLITLGVPFDISRNTIVSNTNIVTGIQADIVIEIMINNNNFFDNTGSYIFNNELGGSILDATSNWWGFTSAIIIKSLNRGADSNAVVDASTPLSNINSNAPMSRPVGVFAKRILGGIGVSWVPAAEPNVAGYQVHWGSTPISESNNVRYDQTQDIGIATSYTIPDDNLILNSDHYIAVTAYNGARVTDIDTSIINDNLAAGSESWYSVEFFVKKTAVIDTGGGGNNFGKTNSGDSGGGSSDFWWVMCIGLIIAYRRLCFTELSSNKKTFW